MMRINVTATGRRSRTFFWYYIILFTNHFCSWGIMFIYKLYRILLNLMNYVYSCYSGVFNHIFFLHLLRLIEFTIKWRVAPILMFSLHFSNQNTFQVKCEHRGQEMYEASTTFRAHVKPRQHIKLRNLWKSWTLNSFGWRWKWAKWNM